MCNDWIATMQTFRSQIVLGGNCERKYQDGQFVFISNDTRE